MEDKCLAAFAGNNKEEALRLLKLVKDQREVKDGVGWTLLHFAAARGWTDIVELLITKYKCYINCGTFFNSWTPVHEASECGQLDVIKCLVNTGKCDLFIKDYYGNTPLDEARDNGHHEIVEFLTNVMTTSTLTCK